MFSETICYATNNYVNIMHDNKKFFVEERIGNNCKFSKTTYTFFATCNFLRQVICILNYNNNNSEEDSFLFVPKLHPVEPATADKCWFDSVHFSWRGIFSIFHECNSKWKWKGRGETGKSNKTAHTIIPKSVMTTIQLR